MFKANTSIWLDHCHSPQECGINGEVLIKMEMWQITLRQSNWSMSIITPFPISKHEALCLFSGAKLDTDTTHGPAWTRVSIGVRNLKIRIPWNSPFGSDLCGCGAYVEGWSRLINFFPISSAQKAKCSKIQERVCCTPGYNSNVEAEQINETPLKVILYNVIIFKLSYLGFLEYEFGHDLIHQTGFIAEQAVSV